MRKIDGNLIKLTTRLVLMSEREKKLIFTFSRHLSRKKNCFTQKCLKCIETSQETRTHENHVRERVQKHLDEGQKHFHTQSENLEQKKIVNFIKIVKKNAARKKLD